jgi:hypothetical protein
MIINAKESGVRSQESEWCWRTAVPSSNVQNVEALWSAQAMLAPYGSMAAAVHTVMLLLVAIMKVTELIMRSSGF